MLVIEVRWEGKPEYQKLKMGRKLLAEVTKSTAALAPFKYHAINWIDPAPETRSQGFLNSESAKNWVEQQLGVFGSYQQPKEANQGSDS